MSLPSFSYEVDDGLPDALLLSQINAKFLNRLMEAHGQQPRYDIPEHLLRRGYGPTQSPRFRSRKAPAHT
jgi:hypothetical protein